MEQSEADSSNKYAICSRCKIKFINDDDNIKTDSGYNRLKERYKKTWNEKNPNKSISFLECFQLKRHLYK